MLTRGWKILTHDGCSPIQGGRSLLGNGAYPITLPRVPLDLGPAECAAGWNYTATLEEGWRIAGLWPTGRPARVVAVEASPDAIERGGKRRASALTLLREATDAECHAALRRLSLVFGEHAERMAQEQAAWLAALGRPRTDPHAIQQHLAVALSARGLSAWTLQRFDTARAAWDAWAAWDALTTFYAAHKGWITTHTNLASGLREAYEAGLEIVIPTMNGVLGWTMAA